MKHRITRSAAFALLSIVLIPAAAQTVQRLPSTAAMQAQTRPDASNLARVDPTRALLDQIAELRKQVNALQQANDALAARVQTLDAGLGQVVTQNVAQSKQLSDLNATVASANGSLAAKLAQLDTRLAQHRHSYTYNHVSWNNASFVTSVGGIGSADKKDLASYISSESALNGKTGPAE